jgi:hypothetical protein
MYTTSLKTWARAVAVDSILIAALVAGVIYHIPYALEVSVFFMWWISVLGLVFGLIIAVLPGISQAAIESLKEQLEGLPPESEKAKELAAKIAKAEEGSAKLWSVKMVNRLAASRTYLAYHWITDIVVWSLLVIAGHPILATFKVASFLISCILIGVARKKYRERLGIKSPDDIEEEFAKHRAHIRQVNNVVDDKITK